MLEFKINKMKKIEKILLAVSLFAPVTSFAALQGISDLLVSARDIINEAIPVIIGLALIFFFWGLIQFIRSAGQEKGVEEGKRRMLWGIVALFVMLAIFGILNVISDAVGIKFSGIQSIIN